MPLPPTAALARRLAQARRKLVRDGATPHRAIQGMSSWLGELETLVSVTAYHPVPATKYVRPAETCTGADMTTTLRWDMIRRASCGYI
jgi:hypothetical protein